jgi:acyl-CoA thioesterase I
MNLAENDRRFRTRDAVTHRTYFMKKFGKIVSTLAVLAAMALTAYQTPAAAATEEIRLLVLGDSLAAGLGLAPNQAFPVRLQDALAARGRKVRVINAGVSGDTTAGGLARLDWVLADKPQVAIVELGANDALRGLDVRAMRANLTAILKRFEQERVKVLLAGMKAPPNYGSAYVREYEQVFAGLVKDHDVIYYPFFLDGVAAQRELNQGDGIHPNAKGVDLIVANILPYVEKLLSQVGD